MTKPTIIPKHGIKPTPVEVETTTQKTIDITPNQTYSITKFVIIGLVALVVIGTVNNATFSSSCSVKNLNSYIEIETSTQCLQQANPVVQTVNSKLETEELKAKNRLDGSLIANTIAQKNLTNNGEFCLVNGMAVRKPTLNGQPVACKN